MEFDEKIALLQQLTMRAYIFHQIWWIYEGVDTKPKFDAAYHDFSEFLRFDCHAQWVSMIMYLSLLFEARRDTVNLRALIQEAATAGVPAAQIDTATQILKQADHLAKKVAILRSNLFAHRSAELSYEDAFRKAEITPNQLRELAGGQPPGFERDLESARRPRAFFQSLNQRAHAPDARQVSADLRWWPLST